MLAKIFHRSQGVVLFFVFLLVFASCSTSLRKITYIDGIKTNVHHYTGQEPEVYRIRPNDQIFIQVISDDPLNAAFLNLTGTGGATSAGSANSLELITYLVDEAGNIEYPYLGQIKVGGLTVSEVNKKIQQRVDNYLESASVFVKLVNRNITVLGEVNSPGQKLMVKNQLNIFEALGTAGDITDYGNRQNVKIIRDFPTGKEVVELDLTDPKLIYSPFYYILPHDIVYVEHRSKVYGAKNMPYSSPITIAASLLSVVLLTLNLIK